VSQSMVGNAERKINMYLDLPCLWIFNILTVLTKGQKISLGKFMGMVSYKCTWKLIMWYNKDLKTWTRCGQDFPFPKEIFLAHKKCGTLCYYSVFLSKLATFCINSVSFLFLLLIDVHVLHLNYKSGWQFYQENCKMCVISLWNDRTKVTRC
jgi:hypothetical protein